MRNELLLESAGAAERAGLAGDAAWRMPQAELPAIPENRMTRQIARVGLFIESSRGSGRALLQGVAKYAHHHGPWSFYWEPGGLEKAWPKLKALELDGLILRDVDKLDEALAFEMPAVVVGHQHSEIPGVLNVVTDSETIGRMAAEHLLACGFKHFAYCGVSASGSEPTSWSKHRMAAFEGRVRESGFTCASHIASASRPLHLQRRRLANWLLSLPKPVGVMACNDDCGSEVMEACKLAGLKVPDTVGVIGADNDEVVCGLSDPALSSVAINFERAGYEAAQALDHLMRRRRDVASRITVHATHVAERKSTDVIAVENPQLARALRFIHDRAREAVSVTDVARAAGLSRRALEKRVREQMSCSVLDEIRRVRTDHIARLLVETHLPVTQIASSCGFEDSQHFARYFRSVKRMSPIEYRKRFAPQLGGATPNLNSKP
jgi:LacI family transcriptional regulator